MNEPVTDFRVLVVEDDPDMAAFLARLLAGMAVESGEVALRGKSEPIRVYSIRP